MLKILILSGGGYIGHVLTDHLLSKNKFYVTVVDRFIFIKKNSFKNNSKLKIIKDDIRKLKKNIYINNDIVIDLTNVSISPKGIKYYDVLTWQIDYETRKRNIILSKENGVKKFLYPSSCSVYGFSKKNKLLSENDELSPKSTYAKAQAKLEKFAITQGDNNFCISILRLPTVFGISNRTRFDVIINSLVYDIYKHGKVNLLRNGKQKRPFVHIKDVARAFEFFIHTKPSLINNKIFNVGEEKNNINLIKLTKLIFKTLNKKDSINWYGKSDDRSYHVSFKKIKKLGYKCKYDITYGIKEIYNKLNKKLVIPKIKNYNIKWLEKLRFIEKNIYRKKNIKLNQKDIKEYNIIKMYGGILDIYKEKNILIQLSEGFLNTKLKKIILDNFFYNIFIYKKNNKIRINNIKKIKNFKLIDKYQKNKIKFSKIYTL